MSVLALSGGVGGAKLCLGLARVAAADALTIVANTADDFQHLGLTICPDIDTLLYTLSGRSHPEQGWGLAGESWYMMAALKALGGPDWFQLGDKDLATHLYRTQLLADGVSLSAVTAQLAQRMGLAVPIVPMTDSPVRTVVDTDQGELPFQQYFVQHQCQPIVRDFCFKGIDQAQPQQAVLACLRDPLLQAVVICPSNPYVSVDPILQVPGYRQALAQTHAPVVAVSPIVAGTALKGPAAKMMAELGREVSALSVARHYGDLVDIFVLDEQDAALAPAIAELGMRVLVLPTVMRSTVDKEQLATALLNAVDGAK